MRVRSIRTGFVPTSSPLVIGSLPLITGVLVALLGLILSGCAPKESAAPSITKSAAGQPGASATDVKGTPQQEAAKQKAIQDGPAIQAAIEAQQHTGK